jgi:hypothetical protein
VRSGIVDGQWSIEQLALQMADVQARRILTCAEQAGYSQEEGFENILFHM